MTLWSSQRIDTAALKRRNPIATVVARCGIALHPAGRALVGRCPFHRDGGRPNLHLYPDSDRWWCYRCDIGGDAIDFIMRCEGLGFRDACAWLDRDPPPLDPSGGRPARPHAVPDPALAAAERACLSIAVEQYHRRLLREPLARAYCAARGLDRDDLVRFRLGYAGGGDLRVALRRAHLPLAAAHSAGLFDRGGDEWLAGRIVVPELRADGPRWLIGRALPSQPVSRRYLGLPGRKPLLGWECVHSGRAVYVTEGIFDRLTLARWGLPALALAGTHARREVLTLLARFPRVYLVLDSDRAGQEATAALCAALGSRALPIALPNVKDVAELGPLPHGARLFRRAVERVEAVATAPLSLAA